MNGISKLLSSNGFIPVNKTLIKKLGLHEAIILGELCSEYDYWEQQDKLENDMFYSTRDNIEENTGLNDHYQRKAITTLKDKSILSVERKGIPATNYYKIHFDKILNLLSTRCTRDAHQEVDSVNLNNNKQTKIKQQENNSKELLQSSPSFEFGKQKPKRESLYTKCVALIDDFINQHNCGNPVRNKLIEYLKYRLSVTEKPLYVNMWKGMLIKLNKLHQEGYGYEPIIDYCLERGYLSFYPPAGMYSGNIKSESGSRHVPVMTEKDYEEEEKRLAELEAKGIQVRF